ncbi:hypothetical protein [Portibacter marinus]|uniref:hypothetical protein n=1 Tax=Portibacter marinus TaxID=2898660 RepID=UPI001F195023|nr:hypothetical protein [Portibacter marinus]
MKSSTYPLILIAFALALIGFILDMHERVENIAVNVFDILLMTVIIFSILSLVKVLRGWIGQITAKLSGKTD